jgi:hypothetical protein
LPKEKTMKMPVLLILAALPLTACATTAQNRAETIAYCQKMEAEMGVVQSHDHASAKGMPGNSMNLTHDQCRRLLHEG